MIFRIDKLEYTGLYQAYMVRTFEAKPLLTEPMLDVDTASQLIGLAPNTLRRLAWQRKITSYKILGTLRFKRSDLEKLIQRREGNA